MAPAYTIEFNADAALRTLKEFPTRTERAVVRSLNRARTTGRATMARLVAQDMGLKVGVVKEAIKDRPATPTSLEVRLAASLKRIPLIDFGAKGPMPSRGRGRGVTYRIGTGGRGRVETAFLAQMASGHRGVFKRAGRARLPIQELFGPSLGHVFAKHRAAGIAAMRESFEKNLEHELRFAPADTYRGYYGA